MNGVDEKLDLESLQSSLGKVDSDIALSNLPKGRLYQTIRIYKKIKIKMYSEKRHDRPHIHIDYGREHHVASYAIDSGERLEGNLEAKYDKAVCEWVGKNRDPLLRVWNAMHTGKSHESYLQELSEIS